MTRPFPNAVKANTSPLSAKIPDAKALADFKSRVSYAAKEYFPEMLSSPARSASVIYLGLCYLRELYLAKKFSEATELCQRTYDKLLPETGGGKGINCSYFKTAETIKADTGGFQDHSVAIMGAMDLFLSTQTSTKKRCAVLLSIGTRHADQFRNIGRKPNKDAPYVLPVDDSWIPDFDWKPEDMVS